MSETVADGFVATFKAGKGYEAPWLVIHAPSPELFKQRLDSVSDGLLHQLAQISASFQAVVAVEEKLGPTTLAQPAVAAPAAVPSAAPVQQSAPAAPVQSNVVPFQQLQQQAAPQAGVQYSPNGTVCSKCGERLYYQEWTAKSGKLTKAYKCSGKGFGHDAEFVR